MTGTSSTPITVAPNRAYDAAVSPTNHIVKTKFSAMAIPAET